MRYLIVRRRVDIVEDGAREPPPRELPKIVEVMTIGKAHGRPRHCIRSERVAFEPTTQTGNLSQSAR
jgi:hypothetical protein